MKHILPILIFTLSASALSARAAGEPAESLAPLPLRDVYASLPSTAVTTPYSPFATDSTATDLSCTVSPAVGSDLDALGVVTITFAEGATVGCNYRSQSAIVLSCDGETAYYVVDVEPLTIGIADNVVTLKFRYTGSSQQGWSQRRTPVVRADGSTYFTYSGSIIEGFFTVDGEAVPSIELSYNVLQSAGTREPDYAWAYSVDPEEGSEVETLERLQFNFGWPYVYASSADDTTDDSSSIPTAVTVYDADGLAVATATWSQVWDDAEGDYAYQLLDFAVEPALSEPGTYTIEFPEGYFAYYVYADDSETYDLSPAFTLSYTVTGADGIASIAADMPDALSTAVYDLQGRRVNRAVLPAGVYIIGGRKVYVK